MSGVPGFLDFSAFAPDLPPLRVIDPGTSNIIAEVTIEEDHLDQMVVTEHPVEQSAAIADHAYRRPRELRLHVGWSNAYGGSATFAEQIYQQVLALQWQRRPFAVYTGKSLYSNMLIAELRTTTNSATEFSFIADIYLREILLVNTQVIPGGVPNNQQQLANPPVNQPTSNAGMVTGLPATPPSAAIPPLTGNMAGFPAVQSGTELAQVPTGAL